MTDDQDMQNWIDRHNTELRPMIKDSAYVIGLISGSEPDAKQAVEIGFTLLLGKPLILAVSPGAQVPPGLVKAADAIVEADLDDPDATMLRLRAVMETIVEAAREPQD